MPARFILTVNTCLQIMSYWHREDIALQVAEYMERQTELRKPKVYVDLLES